MMMFFCHVRKITIGMVSFFSSEGWRRMLGGSFLILMVLNMYSAVQAESSLTQDSLKEPLIEHLEFLGYQCDLVEVGIRAKHSSKIHLYITYAFGGIRMQTGFPGKTPQPDVASRYLVTNALMQRLSVIQLYWSAEGNLFAMAWMPGRYEKMRFALFLEAWDHDASLLRKAYDQLKPFLKEQPKTSTEAF